MLPNEKYPEIAAQYKALTDKDKVDLTEWFKAIGIEIIPAEVKAAA